MSHTRLPRAEREQQTLAAARALFADRGFAAVTMDDVAAEVGVTKPLLYSYFGNKERLYLACMAPAGEALLSTVVDATRDAGSVGEMLERGIRAFFRFVDDDREAWRVLFDESAPEGGEVARAVKDYRERLVGLVAAERLAQLPEDVRARAATEVEAMSTALLGAVEALARWWLRTEAIPAGEAADLLITTLTNR